MIVVDDPGSDDKAYWAIKHAEWNGWSPADFIFPSFLFLVGISIVYSFSARLRRGESRRQILLHAFKRSLVLIAVGLFVNASPFIGLDVHTWRFEGVTQRIALCYFVAAILVLGQAFVDRLIAIVVCLVGIGRCCALCQCPAWAFRDTIFHSWTPIKTSPHGSIGNCSWDISSTERAIRKV